jgi:multidrug efflux pump subunit AcrA (membrane-fusion protein)
MRKVAMKLFVALTMLALLVISPAQAQTSYDQRVATLKAQLEGLLDNQKAMAAKNNCKLETRGEIAVEQGQGYYAFTLPNITYTDAKGVRSEIGMIAINAVPELENDSWRISLALPTPINSYDATGKAIARTEIGTQNASGLWHERLGHFTSVTSRYNNVQISDLVHQNTITIGELSFFSNMEEGDQGLWTGAGQATLSNISHYDAETNIKGNLPKIVLDTNLSDRASKFALTREDMRNRAQRTGLPDFYNIFSNLFGAPEQMQAVVTGLNPLMTQLQQATLTAKPEQRQNILAAALGVTAFYGVGKPVANDNNSRLYTVRFQGDGKVMVNDMDVSALLKPDQSLLKPKAKAAPATTAKP